MAGFNIEIIKPMSAAQERQFNIAKAQPWNPTNKEVLQKAQAKGFIQITGEIPSSPAPGVDTGQVSTSEAIGRGLEEGASLGLAKQSRAASGALFEALNPEPEQKGLSFLDRFSQSFKPELAGEKQRVEQIQENKPYSFGLSKGAGALVPLAPALVSGVAPAAAMGAAAGGIEAATGGDSVLEGMVIGGGAVLAGAGVGKALGALGKGLKGLASKQVLKAMQLPLSTMRRLSTPKSPLGKAIAIADDLVERKIANNPKMVKGFQKKAAEALDGVGKSLRDKFKQADELVPEGITLEEVKGIVGDTLDESLKLIPDTDVAKLAEKLTSGLPDEKMSINTVWEFVKKMDKVTRRWDRSTDPVFSTSAGKINQSTNALRKLMLDKVRNVSPELAGEMTLESSAYRTLRTAEEAIRDQVLKGSAKSSQFNKGLFETIAGAKDTAPARLGGAKILRGAGGVVKGVSLAPRPLGVAGAFGMESN